METIDSVSVTILFGAVLVLAGIMSSLVALRFGAPCCWSSFWSACWRANPALAASSSTTCSWPTPWAPWRSA